MDNLSCADWAQRYEEWGMLPIPVIPRGKRPTQASWNDGASHAVDITPTHNVGCVMTDRYVDVDLDHPLAQAVALELLPATKAVFGRGKTITHMIYEVPTPLRYQAWPGYAELRTGYGHQTIMPPSVHPSGQTLEWFRFVSDPTPTAVTPHELEQAVRTLVGLVMIAEQAQPGNYHSTTLAMAGYCYHRELDADTAENVIIWLLHHQGSNLRSKQAIIHDTYTKGDQGDPVAVWSHLLDQSLVDRIKHIAPCGEGSRISAEEDFAEPLDEEPPVNPFLSSAIVASQLVGEPEVRQWVWEQYLPRSVVSGLSGPPGVAKSTLALQLGVHVATGQSLFGKEVTRGRCFIASVEDDANELHRRVLRITRGMGVELGDLGDRLTLCPLDELAPILVNVDDKIRATKLYELFEQAVMGYDLVVLDLANDFWNGNENYRAEVASYIRRYLGGLARRNKASLLTISHPSNAAVRESRAFAGSTAVVGSYRSAFTLTRGDGDVLKLSHVKSNYGSLGQDVLCRWSHGYLEYIDPLQQADEETARLAVREGELLEVMQDADWTYAYDLIHEHGLTWPRAEITDTLRRLHEQGRVLRREGKKSGGGVRLEYKIR